MTATTHSSTNWLIFRIGRVACAVPALSVASILPVPEHITALPGADAGSPGLFHHGSGTVAIVDLRHRFGCDRVDPRRGRLLLGRIGNGSYGFWVDSIVGLADGDQVKPAPLPPELPHNVFSAALRYQDELVLCSDLPPLLAMRDAGGLRHLVCTAPTEPAAPPPAAATTPPRTAPPPTAPAPPLITATLPRTAETRREPAPRPESAVSHRTAPAHPARPAPPAAPRRPAATPPRPTPARPHPAPAAATSVAAPRVTAPRPSMETVAYTPPPPPAEHASTPAPDRPWPLLLLLVLLAAGGGYFLWPSANDTPPQITALPPPLAYVAPEPVPVPAPAPAPAEPVAAPATPLFSSEGIQVEQNGKEITIVIERAKPAPVAQPVAAEGTAESVPADAPAPAPEPAPEPEPPQMYVHTVVKGDTLWAIAEHYLDDPWRYRELAQLSRIKNPDLIYPGNKVRIIIR